MLGGSVEKRMAFVPETAPYGTIIAGQSPQSAGSKGQPSRAPMNQLLTQFIEKFRKTLP